MRDKNDYVKSKEISVKQGGESNLKLEDGFGVNDLSGKQATDDGRKKRKNTILSAIEILREKLVESGLQIDRRQSVGVAIVIALIIVGVFISYVNSQPHPVNEFSANEVGVKNGEDGGAKNASASNGASTESSKENNQGDSALGSTQPTTKANGKADGYVTVHVAGSVSKPGVYKLKSGSRINDAVNAAGGGAPMSDINSLNLAEKVQDAQRIYVPKKGETPPNPSQAAFSSGAASSAISGANINGSAISAGKVIASASGVGTGTQLDGSKIDLNTASIDQLDSLPGVGQVTAQRIIDYRAQHGAFKSVSELQEIEGIGPKKFDQLKPHVIVN
jgi:competence protein ComEA